jgi:hypothetical protein
MMWDALGLVLRRFFAFLVDLSIVGGLAFMCVLGVFMSGMRTRGSTDDFLSVAAILMYFGLWEARCAGRTPGKLLFRIRSRLRNGGEVMAFHAFARAAVVFLVPPSIPVAYSFVSVGFGSPAALPDVPAMFLVAAGALTWCVSVVTGGGRASLPDAIVGTETIRESPSVSSEPITWDRRLLLLTVACSGLLLLPFAWSSSTLATALLRRMATEFTLRNSPTAAPVLIDRDAFARMIPNGALYLSRRPLLNIAWADPWQPSFAPKLETSPEPKLAALFKQQRFQSRTVCELQVTRKGLWSGDFQRAAVLALASSVAADPTSLLEVHFTADVRLGPVWWGATRTMVAAFFPPTIKGMNAQDVTWVVLPSDTDDGLQVRFGLASGHFEDEDWDRD